MSYSAAVITISDKGFKGERVDTSGPAVCKMLVSAGSADCVQSVAKVGNAKSNAIVNDKKDVPSMEVWLKEAKKDPNAGKVGMYLTHNGIVRETAKAMVRDGEQDTKRVVGMLFSYDKEKVDAVIEETYQLEGIFYVRVWLNEGSLKVGDDIMYVLIGGDIRPHVVEALNFLVGKLKAEGVTETELF